MYIIITEIPRIVDYTNVTGPLAVGDTKNISCTASGEPLPTFQWYRDNELLTNQSLLTTYEFKSSNFTQSVLEIRDVAITDGGTYTCQVNSIAGNASVELTVVVMPGMIYACLVW